MKEPSYEKICSMLIKTIQLSEKPHSKGVLEIAADVGCQIMIELCRAYPEKNSLLARYKTLIYALSSMNPGLRIQLIGGEIKAEDFVKMTERDLASDEQKKVIEKREEHVFAYKRTDAVLEFQRKNCEESVMHSCFSCKSRKIRYVLRQTRCADEPMTAFFTCLDCGKCWRR